MTRPTVRPGLPWTLVALGVPLLAAATAMGMYAASPVMVAGAFAGAGVAVAVFQRPIVGIGLALLATPLETISLPLGGSGLSVTEALLILSALAGALQIVVGREHHPVHLTHLALGGLLVLVLLGTFYAEDTSQILRNGVMWTAFTTVSLLVARARPRDLEPLLTCLVIAGGAVGVVAMSRGGDQQLVSGGAEVIGRASGAFGHPNVFAYFLVLALPQAIVLTARGPVWRRVLAVAAIAPMVMGLMLTLSRTGIIGAIVALGVLLLWADFRRAIAALLLAVCAFGAVNFDAITKSREISLVSKRLSTVSSSGGVQRDPRAEIWGKVPAMIGDHPVLGVGQGNFPVASPRYGLLDPNGLAYSHAHNVFLTFAVELGLLGLTVFIALLVGVGQASRRALSRAGPQRPLAISLTASLVGLLVAGQGDHPPANNAVWATALILMGALVALSRAPAEPPA